MGSTNNYIIQSTVGTPPMDLAAAKQYLRLTHSAEDTNVQAFLDSAILYAEDLLGYHIVGKTVKQRFKSFPDVNDFNLPVAVGYVSAVTSLEYYDSNEVLQSFDVSKLTADTFSKDGNIILDYSETWPTSISEREYPITLIYTTSDSIDDTVMIAIRKLLGHMFARREDILDARTLNSVSKVLRLKKLYNF